MVDLRSDTVTRPSKEMRMAMANAEVGDDVFSEDPTVCALQEEVADLLGKEAALLTPSGCMANQLALKVHTREGDEVIVEADSHIFNYETTGASFLSRVQLLPVAGVKGILTPEQIAPFVRERAYYMPITRLLALENTHNRAGGTVYSTEEIAANAKYARSEGIAMHLDGARLWNAVEATGSSPKDFGKHFNTVSVCFSKGLGAPIGSALCGPKDKIEEAHRMRKMWGGGMRQAGIIAAGAQYALHNNRARLSEDHANAKRFATLILENTKNVSIDMDRVQTNIVLMRPLMKAPDLDKIILDLDGLGVRISRGSHGLLRAVTHLDVNTADCETAARTIAKYFN